MNDFGPNKAKAYGIVEASYFISDYVVSHELGHLLGCHHNWPKTLGNDNTDICAHAYRWIEDYGPPQTGETYEIDGSWITILGIPIYTNIDILIDPGNYYLRFSENANVRILNYSNPNVVYDGHLTGEASGYIADNSRHIRNAACEVADFYPTQDLSVFITTSSCSTVPFTFTADITEPSAGLPGQGPYTVTWFWNTSGNFNTSFSGNETSLGSGQVLTINEHPNCRVYWVKCKVVAADQTTVVRFKKVDLTPLHCYCVPPAPGGGGTGGKLSSTSERDNQALKFFPNPVTGGEISFEHPDLSSSNAKATISDVSGRTMLQTQIFTNAAGQSSIILEHALPSGLYFLHLQTVDGLTWDNKFTVLKN